ncbi:MAG: tripartite tricarboxylate transporter substrate binding protein [Casimicrobiaceae bacterium]|nr:tripartite tricarboxylate transporter substrate binding protein [Casimicrobiaceae bacterium]MCX8099573.1 tripartite tricarboxylate transporter substrate binding protein [Casimicrobiaceae bacterium]
MVRLRLVLAAALFCGLAAPIAAQSYPERELNGIIQWGAGGATDVVARAITPGAEEALGKKIVLQNRPGGVGAIATNFVFQQPADGYTLLYGAENPQIHPVLGLSDLDYSKFFPVNIIARGTPLLVVRADKPWNTFRDMLTEVQANPGKVKAGSTGAGGLPFTVTSMISTATRFPVTQVPFDGDGPGITALLGGHIDFMFVGAGAAAEHIRAGRLKALAVIDETPYGNVPPITRDLPSLEKYLPWGPFYGVFVKRETPEPIKARLVAAFKKAADDPKFKEVMAARGNVVMNISGAQAEAFLKKWQSVTAWIYQEVGAAKKNPAELGIPKP